MCSAALVCDTSWSANQELQGSRTLNSEETEPDKNAIDASGMNESGPRAIASGDSDPITKMLVRDEVQEAGTESTINLQQVARHDSGVPEDLVSPCPDDSKVESEAQEEDPDGTMNSDCNVTVIHVTTDKNEIIAGNNETNDFNAAQETQDNENPGRDFTPDSKDSKDGSDSGVEGCANELPRVEYASSCNGLDEVSCGSSLVSCCSVYEDPCGVIIPEDSRLQSLSTSVGNVVGIGGEGTSEGGSESSSLAGSCSTPRTGRPSTSAKRSSFASSSSSNVSTSTSKRKIESKSNTQSSLDISRSSMNPRGKTRVATGSAAAAPRSSSTTRNSLANCASRDRGRSREGRSSNRETSQSTATPIISSQERRGSNGTKLRNPTNNTPSISSGITVRTRTRQLPDSLPSSLTTEIDRDLAAQRGRSSIVTARSRGGASTSSRGRGTPGSTPCDDSRKSLVPATGGSRNLYSARNERSSVTTSLDEKALEAFATLPRSKNRNNFSLVKSVDRADEMFAKNDCNRAKSRETSLSRINGTKKPRVSGSRDSTASRKCLPAYPRTKNVEKTRIYHEISVQTGLTGQDIDNVLAGVEIRKHDPENIEKLEAQTQTEGIWEDVRKIQTQLRNVSADANKLKLDYEKLESEKNKLELLLAEERADHAFARQELDKNSRRVLAMLGTPQSEHDEASDSFLELETHFQSSGKVVADQQIEIADLQSLCRMLNRDLEKSLAAQKSLLQQQQELEAESTEMQDFLQEEKATLVEALKDAEVEIGRKDELLAQRDIELARLTEECKHLVRMSEQRRQENLSLGMKLNAVERRGRELLLGQGAAVSGAAVALSGLGTRLEGLVDQLVRSYKISEKDLEDVVYHNEAYSRSNSSAEASPVSSKQSLKECTPSPKRGSFVSAVIGAIRNAATHPFAARTISDSKPSPVETTKHIFKEFSTESSSDLLDFETEPCLMMESVLEDVPLPDTYSHNMVSSSDSLRRALSVPEPIDDTIVPHPRLNDDSNSLTNLTQAILNRRKAEDEEETGDCESQSESEAGGTETNSTAPITDYCPAVNLVDQVIDVDNLVTKLLKVLRIIQLDNDTCIRYLRDDKSELESKLEAHSSELEELRKAAGDTLDSDEIFADAVDYRRRTVVENRSDSVENETTAQNPSEAQKSTND